MIAYGYCRVSTEEQGGDGYGLAAQRAAIKAYCASRDWKLAGMHSEIASASSMKRPLLEEAIQKAGQWHGKGIVVVSRLDRLTRSTLHFAQLLERADAEGWKLVCLDPNVDMTTPYGRAMAGMAAVFAQLERELISQRTKEGMAAARAAGVRLGRPPRKEVTQ